MKNKYKYKGKILVSQPVLSDDIFNRTVILIVEDNEWGTIGFILNKPLDNTVDDLVFQLETNTAVYEGGPVHQHRLFYIHNRPDLISKSIQINENFYWSGNYNDVKEGLASKRLKEENIRFFLGYSGWEEGQLFDEIKEKSWKVMNDDFNFIASWEVDLWRRQLKKLGGDNLLWVNMPKNPSLN